MEKQRGFEIVSKYKNAGLSLPERSTGRAAGYDIRAAEDYVVPAGQKIVLLPTGLKAYMGNNEYLALVSRSSSPMKRGLVLPNSVGIIDADYYNNENNEGEIFLQIMNITDEDVLVKKGDRIAQGIFMPFLLIDDDQAAGERQGGFGSTGTN